MPAAFTQGAVIEKEQGDTEGGTGVYSSKQTAAAAACMRMHPLALCMLHSWDGSAGTHNMS